MSGFTESFMIPYALALGASAFQAGLLSSFRNFILSIVQLKSADATQWFGSRKRLVVWSAWVQALLWIPLALLPFFVGGWAVPALILFYTVGTASAAFGGPAWGSIVSEYLAPEERGRFFGHRTRLIGGWMIVAGLVAGGLLHLLSSRPLFGFGLLCAGAALSRMLSCVYLGKLVEEPWQEPKEAHFTFWQFIRQTRTSNFVQFTLCVGMLNFAVYLAAPYLAVYMLEELRYGYLTYTIITLAGSATAFLTVTRWGQISDRHGNWVVLRWAMLAVAILPLLWPLSRHPVWFFVMYLLGGFLWAGINLSVVNFVYDVATPAKRTRCLAYFNFINGLGVSLGALTGGWFLDLLPALHGTTFITLFLCSAFLRLTAALIFRRGVHEVRQVRQVGLREVMYDLVGQQVIQVLGLLSVRPEEETRRKKE